MTSYSSSRTFRAVEAAGAAPRAVAVAPLPAAAAADIDINSHGHPIGLTLGKRVYYAYGLGNHREIRTELPEDHHPCSQVLDADEEEQHRGTPRRAIGSYGNCSNRLNCSDSQPKQNRGKNSDNTNDEGCQAEGCLVDLSAAKPYYRRHRVCELHAKATAVTVASVQQRFCQQCSKFHVVSEFDGEKRSCRKKLAGHNQRRRKSPLATAVSAHPLPPPPICQNYASNYCATTAVAAAFQTTTVGAPFSFRRCAALGIPTTTAPLSLSHCITYGRPCPYSAMDMSTSTVCPAAAAAAAATTTTTSAVLPQQSGQLHQYFCHGDYTQTDSCRNAVTVAAAAVSLKDPQQLPHHPYLLAAAAAEGGGAMRRNVAGQHELLQTSHDTATTTASCCGSNHVHVCNQSSSTIIEQAIPNFPPLLQQRDLGLQIAPDPQSACALSLLSREHV